MKSEMNGEKQYLEHLRNTLDNGFVKENRTGVDTIVHPYPVMVQHDMSLGFPLLTTKNVAFKSVRVELEGFIKGATDKKWYQDRGCHIWDEWCSPKKVPYGHDDETKKKMKAERDLGPIYGHQWRHFDGVDYGYKTLMGKDYNTTGFIEGSDMSSGVMFSKGIDQLKNIIDTLKTNPNDRRMICSAWNPNQLDQMALPPCHWAFELQHINGTLNLMWHQRSCDAPLGFAFNLSSYALLLHLICKEVDMKEGIVTGVFNDFHIYDNQVEGVKEQLSRDPNKYKFCKIETNNFTSIFDWEHNQTKSVGYKDNHYPKISMPVAV